MKRTIYLIFQLILVTIIAALFITPAFSESNPKPFVENDLKSKLKALDGSIIVVRSKRYDGYYIDAHHTKYVKVTGCPNSQLLDKVWSKFIVHYVRDNIICLESLRYRDHYLDIHHEKLEDYDSHIIKITKYNVKPENKPWALFSVWGNDLSDVGIRSERWTNRWLDAHHSKNLLGSMHDPTTPPKKPWGKFELIFPQPIKDYWKEVASMKNPSETYVYEWTYTYKRGMSLSDTKSVEHAVTFKSEVQCNFKVWGVKFGAEYSKKWAESISTTFDAVSESSIKVTIPPGKTAKIKQLQAEYGPLWVRSDHMETIIE